MSHLEIENDGEFQILAKLANPSKTPNDSTELETFEKHSILFKVKEGEDFNRRNTR
jgi:hypothetical protein